MQAQATGNEQTQVLTSQQSLQSIQTLLKAGLGCITYLRNLLPADNFTDSYLTSSGGEDISSQPSQTGQSFSSDSSKRNVSGFKIMTVTRGFTEEADKLLDYLEYGVFDALQKQYLRSFIFAVYLDNEDPNNIVEAYTFNFHYHTIPGSDTVVPVMSLGEEMTKMSLGGSKRSADPVTNATKKGKIPTLGEVKRSLKILIKTLIQATTHLDALPKRRFATFKLFYYENTPDDYEPPHFRAGDVQKDRWFFSTHDTTEAPERCSVGSLETGFHGVDVKVTSVSGYLPSTEDNSAPFVGTTPGYGYTAPTLTPVAEAAVREQQMQIQRQDALDRRVVWDADDGLCDEDAEGEIDPDYAEDDQIGASLATMHINDSGVEFVAPIGFREEDGNIVPLPKGHHRKDEGSDPAETNYTGAQERVPQHLGQLIMDSQIDQMTQTQLIFETQFLPDSPDSHPPSRLPSLAPSPVYNSTRSAAEKKASSMDSLPPSDPIEPSFDSMSLGDHGQETVDTRMVKDLIHNDINNATEDSEMLDMETQNIPVASSAEDPIESFPSAGASHTLQSASENEIAPAGGVLECECDVNVEDSDCLQCDGGCNRWYHAWCMGYHSAKDTRIPARFSCFDCRVKADRNWDLILVHDLYPRMMESFRDLAIVRRAIKVFEAHEPESSSAFTKLLGCDSTVAGQMFRRLETEGFIASEVTETDDLGLMQTRNRTSKKKAKKSHRRKTTQKSKYVFVRSMQKSQAYEDYFTPEPEVEKKLLGISEMHKARKKAIQADVEMTADDRTTADQLLNAAESQKAIIDTGSQTQEETQLVEPLRADEDSNGPKRKNDTVEYSRPSKKVKISLGPAVDLGD